MPVPSKLIAAYRAAVYEVDTGRSVIRFQVEEPCAALDDLLRSRNAASAVLITAHNPRSREQSAADNMQAHRKLLEVVDQLGKHALPSHGRDPNGTWPAEPGLFILDLSRTEGMTLARCFDQNAIVWIERGSAPALALT